MIRQNITDYLSNKKQQTEDLIVNTMAPALLFANNNKNDKFGNAYIFKRFGLAQSDSIKMSSQITTHYMEDNVARQDHWSIAPLSYSMSGLVGELVYSTPETWSNWVQQNVTDYLKPLSVLSPTFDSYTQSAINALQTVEASYKRYEQIARQIFSSFGALPTRQSNQEYLIKTLQNLRDNRQLVSVYTPFGTYDNLAIENISGTQNNSKYQSTIEISFIQWREVGTETREATEQDRALIAQYAKARVEQQGQASTRKSEAAKIVDGEIDFFGNPIKK